MNTRLIPLFFLLALAHNVGANDEGNIPQKVTNYLSLLAEGSALREAIETTPRRCWLFKGEKQEAIGDIRYLLKLSHSDNQPHFFEGDNRWDLYQNTKASFWDRLDLYPGGKASFWDRWDLYQNTKTPFDIEGNFVKEYTKAAVRRILPNDSDDVKQRELHCITELIQKLIVDKIKKKYS